MHFCTNIDSAAWCKLWSCFIYIHASGAPGNAPMLVPAGPQRVKMSCTLYCYGINKTPTAAQLWIKSTWLVYYYYILYSQRYAFKNTTNKNVFWLTRVNFIIIIHNIHSCCSFKGVLLIESKCCMELWLSNLTAEPGSPYSFKMTLSCAPVGSEKRPRHAWNVCHRVRCRIDRVWKAGGNWWWISLRRWGC